MNFLGKLVTKLLPKKRIVQMGAAIVIAIAAVALGMPTGELKKAICDAPVIEQSSGIE